MDITPTMTLREAVCQVVADGKRHTSQKSIADACGISLQSLGMLMRGETKQPKYTTVAGLASAMDMDADDVYELIQRS